MNAAAALSKEFANASFSNIGRRWTAWARKGLLRSGL